VGELGAVNVNWRAELGRPRKLKRQRRRVPSIPNGSHRVKLIKKWWLKDGDDEAQLMLREGVGRLREQEVSGKGVKRRALNYRTDRDGDC
jgi:hypothetical protein